MICNKCWGNAYTRSRLTGRSQADCYVEILEERKDNHCSIEEQGCRKCGSNELVVKWIDDKQVMECCNCKWLHQQEAE